MLKLMKYELYRRKTLLISILLILVFLQIGVMFGISAAGNWYILSIAFAFIILIGGLLFPFIDTVSNYYSDYKNKHGYMLFLTPNSGHKIIGAKALFAFIELVIMLVLIFAAFRLSFVLLENAFPAELNGILNGMKVEIQSELNIENFTFWSLSPFLIIVALQYFNNIMIAILSITIGKTILSNMNFNWLFALLIYFAMSAIVQFVNTGALVVFGFAGDVIDMIKSNGNVIFNIVKYLSVASGMYLVWIIVSFIVSSMLLNKRTDL